MKKYKPIFILGPTVCPIEKINNLYRMHIIIKSPKNKWIEFYKYIVDNVGLYNLEQNTKQYNIKIDVDPMMFL